MRLLLPRFNPLYHAIDVNNYMNGHTIAIHEGKDWAVLDKLTYTEWCRTIENYDGYKVESLEKNRKVLNRIKQQLRQPIKDIHLFVNTRGGYSFGWHKDKVEVYLFVLRGEKLVKLPNKQVTVRAGEYIHIPKNTPHTVRSKANTVALSVGI